LFLFSHCSIKFKQDETWHLKNNKDFYDRRLEIGICPDCERDIVILIETRISDNEVFMQQEVDEKALNLMKKCKNQVIKAHKTVPKGRLFGFIYGLNTERHNKDGKVTSINQRSCDWQGHTAKVRTIKVK